MKLWLPTLVAFGTGVLYLASLPLNVGAAPESTADGGTNVNASRPWTTSIPAYLQMQPAQVAPLTRLYDDWANRRSAQDDKIHRWQDQLRQLPGTASAQGTAQRLQRSVADARQQVTSDLLSTRAKALQTLTPVQRAQLQSLTTDTRFQVRRDRFYELLLMPDAQLWQTPKGPDESYSASSPTAHRQPPAHKRGSAGYGVYGGYGYGEPQYGVYGTYGQGSVGVQVGVGSGGPSVGIGVGGIFGGHHRY